MRLQILELNLRSLIDHLYNSSRKLIFSWTEKEYWSLQLQQNKIKLAFKGQRSLTVRWWEMIYKQIRFKMTNYKKEHMQKESEEADSEMVVRKKKSHLMEDLKVTMTMQRNKQM